MSIVVAIKRRGNFDHFENVEMWVLAQNTDPIGSGTLCGTYNKNDDNNQVARLALRQLLVVTLFFSRPTMSGILTLQRFMFTSLTPIGSKRLIKIDLGRKQLYEKKHDNNYNLQFTKQTMSMRTEKFPQIKLNIPSFFAHVCWVPWEVLLC